MKLSVKALIAKEEAKKRRIRRRNTWRTRINIWSIKNPKSQILRFFLFTKFAPFCFLWSDETAKHKKNLIGGNYYG
jgi:hypothetical protein